MLMYQFETSVSQRTFHGTCHWGYFSINSLCWCISMEQVWVNGHSMVHVTADTSRYTVYVDVSVWNKCKSTVV